METPLEQLKRTTFDEKRTRFEGELLLALRMACNSLVVLNGIPSDTSMSAYLLLAKAKWAAQHPDEVKTIAEAEEMINS